MVGRPQTHLAMLEPPVRQLCAYAVLALFVVFFFSSALSYHFDDTVRSFARFPDFSQYRLVQTLSPDQFPLDHPTRRVIIVGDIHGSYDPLNKLLDKVSYTPSSDLLIHVGDILTKGSHNGSMDTLAFMATHNITGVRGNHDQKVIEWRAWLDWIRTQPGAPRWLEHTQAKWATHDATSLSAWLKAEQRKHKEDKKWWNKIPAGWTLFGDHFLVAQQMSEKQYAYLRALPLAIHVPSAHVFVVHAGLLPSDPRYKHTHPRQPLAHVPRLPKSNSVRANESESTQALRTLQEQAVLSEVPQNTVPFNVLNLRSILHNKVTKGSTGKPWSKAWKHDMLRCAGFDKHSLATTKPTRELLPCYPATVVYGHAASRGLDVKRWSIGLDSGCVYNRRLTALVLGPDEGANTNDFLAQRSDEDDDDDREDKEEHGDPDKDADDVEGTRNQNKVRFGDAYHGRLVDVSCS
ncbi:hypothetical protein D9615_004385 [Tricholomella constricta]|uniref:Calcineurin-like phosphoesterase domain-containing protein n=1 Tax=Tricholomella constricta TaxID=117010 RepID=A0A8H5HF99_9AGAR|nr:hypothetical protein D9615_004385 [Tricholomella constricta]